jgi:hypothetical protein
MREESSGGVSVGERLVNAAVESGAMSVEGLARVVGMEPGEVTKVAPEVEAILEVNKESELGLAAVRDGDWERMRDHRRNMIRAAAACLEQGVSRNEIKRKLGRTAKGSGDMSTLTCTKSAVSADAKEKVGKIKAEEATVARLEKELAEAKERLVSANKEAFDLANVVDKHEVQKLAKKHANGGGKKTVAKPAEKGSNGGGKKTASKPEAVTRASPGAAVEPLDKSVEIEGDVMAKVVQGMEKDGYCGRKVVVVGPDAVFGCPPGRSASRCTVNKGIINHCDINTPQPKASWACIDAASQLKTGFTKDQLLDMAVATMVSHGSVPKKDSEKARTACSNVFDDMKSHQSHVRRKIARWGFIIDDVEGGRMSIRARHSDETIKYFEELKKREKNSQFKAVVQKAKKVKVQKPTEKKPVSVLVAAAR